MISDRILCVLIMKEKGKTKSISNTAIICLSPFYGGMEMGALRMAKLLSAASSVTLIIKRDAPIEANCKKEHIGKDIAIEAIRYRYYFSFAIIRQVRNIVKKNEIKNIVFFGASELRSLYFSLLGLNVNLVVRHGTTKSHPKKDLFHRIIYSNVNYHVAICEHLAKNVKYIIPFGENTKLNVIYSSLRKMPFDIREPRALSARVINILHVGRFADGKGQIAAVEACDELHSRGINFSLKLVGEGRGGYYQKLIDTINKKEYSNSVYIENFTRDIDVCYREADIFLFPSKGEGLSNAFIEALSYGVVCIAYNNTSFPELCDLGFNIFLANDNDLNSLKIELYKAYSYIKSNCIPVSQNIDLAKSHFSESRELKEFDDILV